MAKQYTEIINGQEITITSNSGRKPPTSVFQRRYERDFPTPEIVTTVDIPNGDTDSEEPIQNNEIGMGKAVARVVGKGLVGTADMITALPRAIFAGKMQETGRTNVPLDAYNKLSLNKAFPTLSQNMGSENEQRVTNAVDLATTFVAGGPVLRGFARFMTKGFKPQEVNAFFKAIGNGTIKEDMAAATGSVVGGELSAEIASLTGQDVDKWRSRGQLVSGLGAAMFYSGVAKKNFLEGNLPDSSTLQGASDVIYESLKSGGLVLNKNQQKSLFKNLNNFTKSGVTTKTVTGIINRLQKQIQNGENAFASLDRARSDLAEFVALRTKDAPGAKKVLDLINEQEEQILGSIEGKFKVQGNTFTAIEYDSVNDALSVARELWRKKNIVTKIETAVSNAQLQNNKPFELAFRDEFQKFAKNKFKKLPTATEEERKIIKDFVQYGMTERGLRGLSRLSSAAYPLATGLMSAAAGSSLSVAGAGPMISLGIATVGIGSAMLFSSIKGSLSTAVNQILKNRSTVFREAMTTTQDGLELAKDYYRFTSPKMRDPKELAMMLYAQGADVDTLRSSVFVKNSPSGSQTIAIYDFLSDVIERQESEQEEEAAETPTPRDEIAARI